MLILSRKPGESLKIGRDVTITITQIKGNRARIGIQAPADVYIRRSELPDFGELHEESAIEVSDESQVA